MFEDLYSYDDNWKDKYIHPDLLTSDFEAIPREIRRNGNPTDIHVIPVFTKQFCEEFIKLGNSIPAGTFTRDVKGKKYKLNGWGSNRHQDYATYDIELNVLSYYEVHEKFLQEYIYPLLSFMYYTELRNIPGDDEFIISETFLVKYGKEKKSLDTHLDDSAVSLNVALNEGFTGGGVYFPKQDVFKVTPMGYGLIHPGGISHKHCGKSILSGERYQLVSFVDATHRKELKIQKRIMHKLKKYEKLQSKQDNTQSI